MTAITHDYRNRYWGHDYTILGVDGLWMKMQGWGLEIRPGDYILMHNNAGETRYEFITVEYMDDPPDMWAATVHFAPRQDIE